jgi:hypothetical protein
VLYFLQSPVNSSLLGQNTFLSTLFSNVIPYVLPLMSETKLHTHINNAQIFCISIFISSDNKRKTTDSGRNGSRYFPNFFCCQCSCELCRVRRCGRLPQSTTVQSTTQPDTTHFTRSIRTTSLRIISDRDICLYACTIQSVNNWKLLSGMAHFKVFKFTTL